MSSKEVAEGLLDVLLPFAEDELLKQGGFYPYGGVLDLEGEVLAVMADVEGDDDVDANDVIASLKERFKEQAEKEAINACGVIYEATVEDPDTEELADAIVAELDVSGGYSIKVCQMYELRDGECEFGNLFAMDGEGEIFVE
ncbi:hypothetical protein JD969_04355 [Planctomycetota bacterium]|nr:hypothetical protein JD969_04355 [Planctomycetota bacterium]